MKVLVVGPDRNDPGGVANYYNVVFPRLANDLIETRYLEIGSAKGGGGILHTITDQIRFWRAIGEFKPDVVHLNPSLVPKSFFRDGFFAFQAKLRRCSLVVFFRGWDIAFEKIVDRKLGWYFHFTYKRADEFIVLASSFAETLVSWGVSTPITLGTTVVSDTELESFSIAEKAAAIKDSSRLKLLFLARLEPEKGVVELANAVIGLLDRGLPVELTIAGIGPATDDLKELVNRSKDYGEWINIVGYVRGQDKFDLFKSHHIFCLPSLYAEGMPNSIMEAMGFGMPVITCPVGGLADFFEDDAMGVLIQHNSSEAISNAIEKLTRDVDNMAQIAHYNHDYARERFLASKAAAMLRGRYLCYSADKQ